MADKSIFVRIVRLMNFIAALMMVINAIIRFTDFSDQSDAFFFILTFYLFGFAALLIMAEMRYKKVLVYLEFLKSRIGKGIYIVLIGVIVFDDDRASDVATAIVLTLIGIFNIVVGCMRDNMGE